jgi:hypothetical protein
MVDPAVLEKAGIDHKKYAGFAAGFGVESGLYIHGSPMDVLMTLFLGKPPLTF